MIRWTIKGAVLALMAAMTIGCGAATLKTDGPRGTVRFEGEPKDAHLFIDETSLGPVAMFQENGVKLRPGAHRILIQKEGYFSEYRLVEVAENALVLVKVTLREIP
jgi:hypothetical protein